MNNFINSNDTDLVASHDAVHAIILNDNHQYLVQLRDNKKEIFHPLHWGLFGGGLENSESEKNCLKREIFEELSINIDTKKLQYFTKFTFDLSYRKLNTVFVSYFTFKIDGKIINNINLSEGIEFKFLTAMEFLNKRYIVPLDAMAIWLHYSKKRKFY